MYQVEISWDVGYFWFIAASGFTRGCSVGGGRKRRRWSKYNQATAVCRQQCMRLMVFWHVGGSHGNYRKGGGGSQHISDAMGIFLSTILRCEINTEIKFHRLLPTTQSSLSS